jgi:beta-glucosidase
VHATRVDDALSALRDSHGTVTFAPGFPLDHTGDAAALREEAVGVARDAEITVVFAGLAESDESEGFDRTTLDLPAEQVELIRAVAAVSPRTVVVLSSGGVVSLEGWHDEVDAVLAGFLLGQAGGSALADLLTGAVDPSGRLAETFPLRLQDTSSYLNFPGEQGHVRYGEGVMVGYRHFVTTEAAVRYPFGHGLSYTTVETSDLQLRATGDDRATVSVTVTNTGSRGGRHVVQVYVATTAGPVRRPARELRAFTKVSLEPGESRTVDLELDRRAFAYWDVREHGWVVAPGEYTVQIGRSASDVVAEAAVTLAGDDVVPELTPQSSVAEWFAHPVVGADLLKGFLAALPDDAGANHDSLLQMIGSMPMRRFAADFGAAIPAGELDRLIATAQAARDGR